MRTPPSILLAVSLAASAAWAQKKEEPASPAAAQRRIALVEQPSVAAVPRAAVHAAARAAEIELKARGYELLPPAQLAAALGKGHKSPACAGAPDCLANLGRLAGVAYVLNVSLSPAGGQFGLKLTVVDADEEKVVSNIMSLLPRPQEPALAEAVKKQVPRVVAALDKHIAGKAGALAQIGDGEPARDKTKAESLPGGALAEPYSRGDSSLPAEAPPESVETRAAGGPGALPYVLIGAGVLGVGVGVGLFGHQARVAVNDFKAGRDPQSARDRAKSNAILSDLSTGVGVALAVTGAALFLFSGRDSAPPPSVAITPTGPGLAVAGRF